MRILITDGGRSESRRPMQRNDCVVRSTSILCGSDYDSAYDFWKTIGRKSHEGFDIESVLKKFRGRRMLGRHIGPRQVFRKRKGRDDEGGQDLRDFVAAYPKGRYFLLFDMHVSCCVDGEVHDTMKGLSYAHGRLWSFYRVR